ncbi:MarR family winged helix-turn-helix transcriptional regulator [Streptacidiphilus melanogenes]|uniref:MarR family winged helix-turn-helix transcriptional regulator n=1 Tax=Streptacidiphilus melanogenes TaxID=411235 RepID=UPI0007C7B603|nr:MarR family winged helix-turn-helix transcriptional regulator [Streptacidiphilus melanogenes]
MRRAGEILAGAEGQTRARWQLMSVVSEEALSVASAARRLGVARPGVQRIATGLVHDGLAEFRDNPDHRTSPLLALTDVGREALGAIASRAAAAHRTTGAGISPEDLAVTRSVLRRLTRQTEDWTRTAKARTGTVSPRLGSGGGLIARDFPPRRASRLTNHPGWHAALIEPAGDLVGGAEARHS